jgi:hypothetical protein
MRPVALLMAVALAITLPVSQARADDTITVKLIAMGHPEGGQENVTGTVAVKSFTIKGKHGTMEIPVTNVTDIRTSSRFTKEGHILCVCTADEQMFEGVIVSPTTLDIAGKYGCFLTSWDDVHQLKVEGNPAAPAGAETWRGPDVRIETTGGARLTGPFNDTITGPIRSIEIECDLGPLSVDIAKVRSIQFEPGPLKDPEFGKPPTSSGSVVTTDGEKLSGGITVSSTWVVETKLGVLGLKADKLKCLVFEGATGPQSAHPSRPAAPSTSPPTAPAMSLPTTVPPGTP